LGQGENIEPRGAEDVRRESMGMKWHIGSQDELQDNAGYMVTISECHDDGALTGTIVAMPCDERWDMELISEEEAVRAILQHLRERIDEYLGHEPVSVSDK
jgi:hypothetical protein